MDKEIREKYRPLIDRLRVMVDSCEGKSLNDVPADWYEMAVSAEEDGGDTDIWYGYVTDRNEENLYVRFCLETKPNTEVVVMHDDGMICLYDTCDIDFHEECLSISEWND